MYTIFDASDSFFRVKQKTEALVPLLVQHGIDAVNPPVEILEDVAKAKDVAQIVYDNGLKWGFLPMPVEFLHPDLGDEEFEDGLKKLATWAQTAGMIGVKYAYNPVFPGHNEYGYARNMERHVVKIKRISKVLEDSGIRYGIEFLGPPDLRQAFRHPFVHTVAGALALIDETGADIGFVFDTFHWYCGTADMDELYLAARNTDKMICLHVNDAIAGVGREGQKDLTRAMPMTTGVIDAAGICKLFLDNGYSGPVLLEPILPTYERFENMKPEDVVAEVAQSYRKMKQIVIGV